MRFQDLGVSAAVARVLARRHIEEPFEIQSLVIPDALSGRDILAKSRTGSGKTLAFAIPIVERIESSSARPAALVLVPTRELAVQVTEEMRDVCSARGVRVASVYGGVSIEQQARRAARAHVFVATPGRLLDLMDRNLVSVDRLKILVLDEADGVPAPGGSDRSPLAPSASDNVLLRYPRRPRRSGGAGLHVEARPTRDR
jgi:ATP-dependent RNA helicase RhlE